MSIQGGFPCSIIIFSLSPQNGELSTHIAEEEDVDY
jgi:hypothetical protein